MSIGLWRWADADEERRFADAPLSARHRRWVEGRLAYLAVLHPAAELRVAIAGADALRALSLAPAALGDSAAADAPSTQLAVVASSDPEADPVEELPIARTLQGRLRQRLQRRRPLLADEIRQAELSARLAVAVRRGGRALPTADAEADSGPAAGAAADALGPTLAAPDGRRTVLVPMYWLELGGAERWALRTVELLRERGLEPVVVIDTPGRQRLLLDPALRDVTVVIADRLAEPEASREALLRLARLTRPVGVLIHHSHSAYDVLPALRALLPDAPLADALHIVEWEDGGFPLISARRGGALDTTQVISPTLAATLSGWGVPARRIVVAPLLRLAGIDAARLGDGADHSSGIAAPFTIAVVGRHVDQKRIVLALDVLRRLLRRDPRGWRMIVHGDGPLTEQLRGFARTWGIESAIEYRSPATPVADTWRDADALLIPSQAEGLTLTALEALAAGVPSISADVGAQRDIVADAALAPRAPHAFARRAERLLRRLAAEPELARELLAAQRAKAARLAAHPDAVDWAADWAEHLPTRGGHPPAAD